MKVLVIDDKAMIRDIASLMVRYILKDLGFEEPEIVVAGNPDEAISAIGAAKNAPFDLILSDIQCDPANSERKAGFDIVAHATNVMPKCVALMMTGLYVDGNLLALALESGAKNCFQKPIILDDLKSKIQHYFKKE